MSLYEIAYFLNSNLKEDELSSSLQKIKDFISELGGEITKEHTAQKKKLAYPVKKASQGYFGYLLFNFNPENLKLLDKKLRLEENILRYLILVVDKNYLAQMRRKEEEIKEKFQKIIQPGGTAQRKIVKSEEREKMETDIEKKLEEILK